MDIPRCEHPNPQWQRDNWKNLNGQWEFDFDFGVSARERKLYAGGALSKTITVPFCPESVLSGIGYTDFIPSVCYRRTFELTEQETSGRVVLHFGAVDFHSYIYVNGVFAGEHIGGYASFAIDITAQVKVGENVLFVIAEDDVRSGEQPAGKQSTKHDSYACYYTRTTGIWQTVWLELTPKAYVKSCKYYPDITRGVLTVMGEVVGKGELTLSATYEGKPVGKTTLAASGFFTATLALDELHLWEIGNGRLYDLDITFGEDTVHSYFGMREVALDGLKFKLNGKTVFLRTVLDQGFYPDGIYTARDDETLRRDITLSQTFGFHGARLHQKVFEKRFLYHCDRAGYIVWGEHANWGIDEKNAVAEGNFLCEWMEIVERDFNSPALIGWCPFNETWHYYEKREKVRLLEMTYRATKLYDPTRPCIDVSGNYHIDGKEIHDVHDYEQNVEKFAECYAHIGEGIVNDQIRRAERDVQPYRNEPIYMSEYGGIRWAPETDNGWGYGNAPKTLEEFVERYCKLTDILITNPYIMGLCYTQLYDVEQEKNGLYCYDRSPKFDEATVATMRAAMEKKAAIEE
ncbi:MAG: beta-galactosidase [Clostridia bacterium]|nr:beta-galactosidase [Clostridia bacterium]